MRVHSTGLLEFYSSIMLTLDIHVAISQIVYLVYSF